MSGRYVTLISVFSLIAACSESSSRIEIPFSAVFNGLPVSCESASGMQLTDLRFYVHKLRLTGENGQEYPVSLDNNDWQQSDLALVDIEDARGGCLNGTAAVNAVVVGTVPGSELQGLKFTLGVPFSSNHGDPLLAQSPLGDADMHWHWRGGYKFLRAGIKSDNDSFWIHLGSTGCEGTIQNITACKAPNRVEVHLDDFVPGDVIEIDLAAFVGGSVMHDAEPSDCSSGPAETSCVQAFLALGLDHGSGTVAGAQRVFTAQSKP